MSVPPGWYPDEDDPELARYWDGSGWTDRTKSKVEVTRSVLDRRVTVRSLLVYGGALIGVAALLVAVLAIVGGGGADATEVVLESAGADGADPFTDSIATEAVDPDGIEAGGVTEVATNADAPVATISGETPGLYGGTGDDAACDPAALVEFLDAHPDKAAAWAGVQGIEPDTISDFVATLTPVVLREDTLVTNHGFSDGRATTLQSLLQAGTAVLVDVRGVPRVRCSCGNPLLEPEGSTSDLTFTGDPWAGFDESRLVTIEPAPQDLETLTVTNLDTGEPEQVNTGTATGTGTDTGTGADTPEEALVLGTASFLSSGMPYDGECANSAGSGWCSLEINRTADEAIYATLPFFTGGDAAAFADQGVYVRVQELGSGWVVTDTFSFVDPFDVTVDTNKPVPDWLQPYVG